MKKMQAGILVIILIIANITSTQALGITPSDEGAPKLEASIHLNPLQHLYQILENFFNAVRLLFQPAQKHSALPPTSPVIHSTADSTFDYIASSPYYRASFKGAKTRINVPEGWVEFNLKENRVKAGEIVEFESNKERVSLTNSSTVSENKLSVSDIFEATDLDYVAETSILHEILILKRYKSFERIVSEISWDGLTPEFQEDGSILFSAGKPVLRIFPPTMTDALGNICNGLHYELVETETGYELHKVVDEEGLKWLLQAQYPVKIDPTIGSFGDAWGSSGITPYGRYLQNLDELVNVMNGHLTIAQTDLVISGRGLNLAISRSYETPAVFYMAEPFDYTPPPVNVGMGWRLNLPYVGENYLYLLGGQIYEIKWVNNTFENHIGSHFVLKKNPDNTFTLTMANGTIFEFDTAGRPIQIKDLDQNTITFNYSDGILTSITDTIGRVITFSYSGAFLKKIIFNGAEIEYGYSNDGNLIWVDDFLDRRTSYYYDTGWTEWAGEWIEDEEGHQRLVTPYERENKYLLSKIVYPAGGYTTYSYDRYSWEDLYGDDGTVLDFFRYYVTDQKVYETAQTNHSVFSFQGNFSTIVDCITTIKDETDATRSYVDYDFDVNSGLIYQIAIKDESGAVIQKTKQFYNSNREVTKVEVYNNGATLSFTEYYAYDNWGNPVYHKDAMGSEQFYSYSNTSTSGFFMDNSGNVIQDFTNSFSSDGPPASVHTSLLGQATRQDGTFVRELYFSYNTAAHPTQEKYLFGSYTDYLTFSGTFNEKTGATTFPIDLQGHTIVGNAVLVATGLPSDDTYTESKSTTCHSNPTIKCIWSNGYWSSKYYSVMWSFCDPFGACDSKRVSIGPFAHSPGTLGYQSYTTNPTLGGKSNSFAVNTYWKAYPAQVQYNLDGAAWKTIASNLMNGTERIAVPISAGTHTLNFSESSSQKTKFSWTLFVPVDNLPEASTRSMTYDQYGNMTSITDQLGNTTLIGYDSQYNTYPTSITDALNQTTTLVYDFATGRVISQTNPKGFTTSYEFDIGGRIIKITNPDLSEVEIVYDDQNNSVTIYDELDHSAINYFDRLGRIVKKEWYISPTEKLTSTCTYNYMGKEKTATDPGGYTFSYYYDVLGRLTKAVNPDSTFKEIIYNDTTNVITTYDENQHKKAYHYDWNGCLKEVWEYTSAQDYYLTQYTYDALGNMTAIIDAKGNTTSYEYDSIHGLAQKTYPDSTIETISYDDAGNIHQMTHPNGTMTFTYNSIYQLINVQCSDQYSVTIEYDENGNKTLVTDPQGTTAYYYDNRDRPTSVIRSMNNELYSIGYEYDAASNLTSIEYPDQSVVTYLYDALNRVMSVPDYATFTYNSSSFLETATYNNGTTTTFQYNNRLWLTSIQCEKNGATLLSMDYDYDPVGNINQLEYGRLQPDQQWVQSTSTFTYDWLDRLTSGQGDNGAFSYTYDPTGNRISENELTYTYNNMDELVSISDGTQLTYDECGNLLTKSDSSTTWEYTHDISNKLIHVEKNEHIVGDYSYDGEGRRISKTEWIESLEEYQTTIYVYSGGQVLYEKNLSTNQETTYVYGPNGRVAKNTNGQRKYYHSDHLGSTRLTTDDTGNPVGEVTYEHFGKTTVVGEEEDYLYTGKEQDEVTGLYYYGARYYDQQMGRWIERDPITGDMRNPKSLNRYVYCLNNPLRYVDPDGLTTVVYSWQVLNWMWLNKLEVIGDSILNFIGSRFHVSMENDDANLTTIITIAYRHPVPDQRAPLSGSGYQWVSVIIGEDDAYKHVIDVINNTSCQLEVNVLHNGSKNCLINIRGTYGPIDLVLSGTGEFVVVVHKDYTGNLLIRIQRDAAIILFLPLGWEGTLSVLRGARTDITVYYYTIYQGVFWILIDGLWYKMPSDWDPSKPMPPGFRQGQENPPGESFT